MAFQPRTGDWPVTRYVSHDCPNGDCGACQRCIQARGALLPNRSGQIFFSPHLFRFEQEARRFLALPPGNRSEIGLLVDLTRARISTASLTLQRCVEKYLQPGGGLELVLTTAGPIPGESVIEFFQTALSPPAAHDAANVWCFNFYPW